MRKLGASHFFCSAVTQIPTSELVDSTEEITQQNVVDDFGDVAFEELESTIDV
jgi:hypothetical protein